MTAQLKAVSGVCDITMKSSTDRVVTMTYKVAGTGVDLSAYTPASFTVREREGAPTDLFTLTLGSGIALSAAGVITLTFTDTQLNLGNENAVYALSLTSSAGLKNTLMVGKFIVQDTA